MAVLLGSYSAKAANAGDAVKSGATDLGNNSTTTYTAVATTTSDVQFLAATAYTSPLALGTALAIGTLDDLNQTAITINGTALLTLSTAANSTTGSAAADLLFVANGANLTINDTAGITFGVTGNIDSVGTLSLGTSPLNLGTTTQTFTGAGNTTVGGAIAASAAAVTINKVGGTATFSGLNLYTGTTTVNAGTLLLDFSANAAPATATNIIKTGNIVTLGGGTLSLNGGWLYGRAARRCDELSPDVRHHESHGEHAGLRRIVTNLERRNFAGSWRSAASHATVRARWILPSRPGPGR